MLQDRLLRWEGEAIRSAAPEWALAPGGQNLSNRPTAGLGGAGNLGGAGLSNERPNAASGFPAAGAGQRPGASAGNLGSRVVPGQTPNANRYNAPSRNDLNGFLGLPSDDGFGHAANAGRAGALSIPSTLPAGEGKFDVNYGTKEGARGGQAGGVTVTGPQGNTVGRAGVVGPQGGAAVVGGVQGANGGTAARGAAVGPNGQVVAGRGAVGPSGYGGGGIATAGPAGAGAGFTRVTPSGRYTAAAAVRGNYNNWGGMERLGTPTIQAPGSLQAGPETLFGITLPGVQQLPIAAIPNNLPSTTTMGTT